MNLKNNISSWIRKHKYELWLIVILLVVFWPFTFQVYIPKWDNLDAYFPYRYTVSDFIQHGSFPLWSPYSYLGSPIYSDLQSGAWSPFVWIVSLFGHYGIGALILELLLCYIIAALGMFKLVDHLVNHKSISFIIALSYGLSGFMVGSAQLMVFLIGIAWLPWIVYFLLKLINQPQLKYLVLLSLSIAVHTSSASPAYTILLVYFIFFFLLWYFYTKRNSSYPYLKVIKHLLGTLVLSTLLLLPYLNAFYEFSPYFNRIERLSLDRFLINPFTIKEYISFIWPYSTVANTTIFSDTSLTLRNGYFGIIGFVGMISSIFILKRKILIPAFSVIILSLILASGKETGLYEYIVHLPGIGLFRHPSIYKTYTIFIGLILCGLTLKNLIASGKLNTFLNYLSISVFAIGFTTLSILLYHVPFSEITTVIQDAFEFKEFSDYSAAVHIAVNCLIWCFVAMLLFILYKVFKIKPLKLAIIGTIIELTLISYLIAPTTVYNKISAKNITSFIGALPTHPSQEHNSTPLYLLEENKGMETTYGLWRNLSMFHKKPAFNGCNPLRFKKHDEAMLNGHIENILQYPIFYSESAEIIINSKIERNSFKIDYQNQTNDSTILVVNQNFHHLWKATINGVETPISLENNIVMSVILPPNTSNTVIFRYESTNTKITALIALIVYLVSCIYLILYKLPVKRRE